MWLCVRALIARAFSSWKMIGGTIDENNGKSAYFNKSCRRARISAWKQRRKKTEFGTQLND